MYFIRRHDIVIDAPPEAVFDYVCNPHSWPEWLAASHQIGGPHRPLRSGETFHEQWQIRRGMIALSWTVTKSERPNTWACRADTDFIGPIVIRYTFASEASRTRFTRELTNPDRPTAPTEAQLRRMDEEARIGLANIKKQVERRSASTAGIKLRVDPDKCQGHARCSALAPELFKLDEFGNARERLASCSDPALIEKAHIARANCPEEAIIISES